MKKQKTLKVLMLSLAMAVLALLPMTTNAQSDGFFRGSMESYENRDAGINSNDGTGITNYGIGEQVPLGSGLLVLAAAGAGYAAMRRKRNKRGVALIIAFAMIITMSNCKKNVETISDVASNGVQITLDVDGGSKVDVNPTGGVTFATVAFESGDIIYVGNNGRYCGYLEHNGTYFTGNIDDTNLSEADYLHFYFMGNKGAKSEPTSVNITDQTNKYPVISYAHSTKLYKSGVTAYSAKLQNYCAIAKFPLSGEGTPNSVYVRGMNNTVTIDFTANNAASSKEGTPYTFTKEGNGTIKLHSKSPTEKWAILLKQDAVTADLLADGFEATIVSVPAIESNTYHASDIAATSLTTGSKVHYAFTVDNKGSVVRFSKGNLQYKPSVGSWQFAPVQYGMIGNDNRNISPSYDGWIDLFGWGTGDNPTNSSTNNDYASFNDWGKYCGDPTGNSYTWRTLTKDEWEYIFGHSTKGWSTVAGVYGYVLRPDGNIAAVASSYAFKTWAKEEASGSVFLPAAGYRFGTGVNGVGGRGTYWSSMAFGDFNARFVYFDEDGASMGNDKRYYGCSVRLVR